MTTLELLEAIADKDYRHAYVDRTNREWLALQVRDMREERPWTQAELGQKAAGMAQARVSLLEDPDYTGATSKTLNRVGKAFDVALIQEYVSFSDFLDRVQRRGAPSVKEFDSDLTALRLGTSGVEAWSSGIMSTATGGPAVAIKNDAGWYLDLPQTQTLIVGADTADSQETAAFGVAA